MAASVAATALADRVVVVTGATSGIGRAVASALAGEVAGLVAFGRSAAPSAAGGNVLAIAGDINSAQDVQALFAQALARFGRIDALINSAGVNPRGAFLDLGHEEWRHTIETNLIGYASVCRAALPIMMKQSHGRIVNLATRLAWECGKSASAYSCSKAGASMLTRCLAAEIDRNRYPDILVNDLIPGDTRTAMNPGGQDPEAVVPFVRDLILLPGGGATGVTFFRGKTFSTRKTSTVENLLRRMWRR
jgi:NAD(P)-dependent dehydrogenase (short-subunit alcohol dehydrogenase family)